jgi:eukaryotic-like serine/threonine-protein kinase
LFQVAASGGTPSRLTTASLEENAHYWPQILPGGRFLYFARSRRPENNTVYAASFANPADRVPIVQSETNAVYALDGNGKSYLLWLRGTTLVAQQFDAGTLRLSGQPVPIGDPVERTLSFGYMTVAASASGLLLYGSSNNLSQFIQYDRFGKPMGSPGEPGEYMSFNLSPDGRRAIVTRLHSAPFAPARRRG